MEAKLKKFIEKTYDETEIKNVLDISCFIESHKDFKKEFVKTVEKCIDEYKSNFKKIVEFHTIKLNNLKENALHWDEAPIWTDHEVELNSECTKILASVLGDLNKALNPEKYSENALSHIENKKKVLKIEQEQNADDNCPDCGSPLICKISGGVNCSNKNVAIGFVFKKRGK